MIEDVMTALIAALDRNTAAHGGAKATATPQATPAPKQGPKVVDPAKITLPMVKAAVMGVKDAKGKPAAQKIIKEAGKAADLASIPPANFKAVMAACVALLREDEAEEEDEAEDDDEADTL